ncbi:ArnT family glycosyltransferase [Ancylobacter amanitiformis]|uniref:4-amino-4-deoxy-L-arabinose transferase-like glycosyltransferase n=1 Tax=Ancylobacter amanitiformis TaxID=217069 RepID=A0ABU0LNT5_9HYPH|nr:glycosyltransferase family 39 protein [Ancylobacter amanitiformis]MDQ0510346.1 4-amino-4-deoxy-L-arabinose transferase-like glycosyltransferase [Ancylobacter amanitiformis]
MDETMGATRSAAATLPPPARLVPLAEPWRGLALILLVLVCLLPGFFSLPVVDRDEGRFAQASRQMLESGDYVVPRLGEETRFKKPIGIYWLQAAAVKATGLGAEAPIWAFRLPSLIGALIAVLITYAVGRRLFDEDTGFIAAALLGASLMLSVEARLAKTDAAQLAAALAAQWVLAQAYLAGFSPETARKRLPTGAVLLFWGALAVGILIKGPIVPLLVGLTIAALLVWDRKAAWLKQLRPAIGVPFMLLIVLPWIVAIAVQAGAGFFHESVGVDLLGKVATGQESHGAPPGAHLIAFSMAFWPGAALAVAAAPWVWRNRAVPAVRFCLCWLVPFWLVFEFIATKLPHYTLPAYPAIALLAAAALTARGTAREPLWMRILVAMAAAGGAISALAGPIGLHVLEHRLSLTAWALAGLVILLGAYALRQALVAGTRAALLPLLAEAAMLYALLFGLVAPQINSLWIAPRLEAAIHRVACPNPHILVAGYGEPSVLFTLGARTRFGNGLDAANLIATGADCRVAVVAEPHMALFEARRAELGLSATPVDVVTGINSGNLKPMRLNLFVAPAAGPAAAAPIQPPSAPASAQGAQP